MRISVVFALLLGCRVAAAADVQPPPPAGEAKSTVQATPVAAAPEVRKAAVLELKATGIDEGIVKNLTDLLTAEAGKIPGYKVISQAEIKDMLGYEIQKQTLGCDEASCFAQIGGALGADLIVTGTFAKLGDTFVVNVRLINIARSETENRVGETIAGKLDLLPDFMRIIAWRLFTNSVPKDVQAGYDATRARLDEQAARAKGDSAALAAAEQARAEAEKAKAEAEKAKAEAEMMKAKQGGTPTTTAATDPTKPAKPETPATSQNLPPPAGGGWQRLGKNISAGVAILGFLAGGTLSVVSFMKTRSVGDAMSTEEPAIKVYDASQADAQAAWDLHDDARYGYAIGAVGVVAAIVFKILEPAPGPATAWRVVPSSTGLAVEF